MDKQTFIETSGNVNLYRILIPIPGCTWQINDKVQGGTLYELGLNMLELVANGYIKNINEPYEWQKWLVGKNEHSVYSICGQCGNQQVPFPLDNKCGSCGYQRCITYYDAQTIDLLINYIKTNG